jgi:hypothetical protein
VVLVARLRALIRRGGYPREKIGRETVRGSAYRINR